ncbi:Nickel/cobalt efflux system RcnA [Luteimicrobium xylanilyticum]|uniref:Nickel/cobalt efflux system n=1 Tax=Luteimicrobium xylanilyticum TaxID=1133546 RepID=A0A5P9QGZ3_9MICO|nr:hypothetical protein [Luteimicrobium xylanilyticum]QFU99735.1 Nickel/cobalt efflux system RcnA [Luteimicrobium xylanilyticum]
MTSSLLGWTPFGELGNTMLGFVTSPHFAPAALAFAFLAGAAHAVGPGHGKSLAAAYLVGSRGTVRDAAWLGGSVAVMHTVSVLVLAVLWTFFDLSGLVDLEDLTGALELVAGLTVVVVGVLLVVRARSAGTATSEGSLTHRHGPFGRAHTHVHPASGHESHHDGHDHTHEHGDHQHEHPRTHDHPATATRPVSRPTLVTLGAAGALTPSPSAFLVLVTGIFAGRSGLAIGLVLAFGVGLASVLFGVGMAALWGRSFVVAHARPTAALQTVARAVPFVTGAVIALAGGAISVLALGGILTPGAS